MDIRFLHLESLNWLWAVLAVALLLVWSFRSRRRSLGRFASDGLLPRLTAAVNVSRLHVRAVLVVVTLVLLVASLLDPRWGVRYREIQLRGIDVFFVLDVSRSMLADDVRPSRLVRAEQTVEDVLEVLGGDRVGLITFAGIPTMVVPLTLDYGSMRLSLNDLRVQQAGRGGSMMGDAIRLATDSFTDEDDDAKAIVVLTDGEDMGSYPVEAAAAAAAAGIRVFTVGLGDAFDGARIPIEVDGQQVFLTYEGAEVWTKMDPALLQAVADAGDGAFVPAGTSNLDLASIYNERIAPEAGGELETSRIQQFVPRFQWFAGLALLILLVESMLSTRAPASVIARREGWR